MRPSSPPFATAARRAASRPVSSKCGTNRSSPCASPPSSMIGIKAFARCWVEAMRPVAPLTMMPIVWLAIVQFRCVAGGEGRSSLDYAMPVACVSTSREGKVPRHIVCLIFDFDTQSGFIARGMTSPTMLSRGEFGLIGAQRILALLKSHGIRATWFVPGFTIESHPRACEAVVRDGHEVAHHSWAHVAPVQQSRAEEEADLVRANDSIATLTGR